MPARRSTSRPSRGGRPPQPRADTASPLTDAEILELKDRLESLPPPLEPLDICALDGFLCGVLVQPQAVPRERWMSRVFDAEGRAPPPGADGERIRALVLRRAAELQRAISARRWFDPWIFTQEEDGQGSGESDAGEPGAAHDVLAWVAGFAAALEAWPELLDRGGSQLNEALALLYRHFDPDDLEDADELLAEIEALGPADDLADAVEGLVRATLLLADEAEAIAGEG